jgi:hypothetical protein
MPYCQARHCDKWLYFPAEKPKRFYRPYRCGEKVAKGERLCELCEGVADGKTQLSRGFNHGLCGDLIPPNSHAYGGPWYLAQVAKYGEPTKEVLAEATEYLDEPFDVTAGPEAAQLFRDGVAVITKKMPTSKQANAGSTSKAKKPASKSKTGGKSASSGGSGSSSSSSNSKQAHLKESITTAALKLKEAAVHLTPEAIESANEPLEVCEVEYVTVRKLQIDGEDYYLNVDCGAVYNMTAFRNGMGERIGRYDEESDEIVGGSVAATADADADADAD